MGSIIHMYLKVCRQVGPADNARWVSLEQPERRRFVYGCMLHSPRLVCPHPPRPGGGSLHEVIGMGLGSGLVLCHSCPPSETHLETRP